MKDRITERKVMRFAVLGSVFAMMCMFALLPGTKVKAKMESSTNCTLQSVTMELDGKTYELDGSYDSIGFDEDVDWETVLKTLKITDYSVCINDCCSHANGHDSVEVNGRCMGSNTDFSMSIYTYEDKADGTGHSYFESVAGDMTKVENIRLNFILDGCSDHEFGLYLRRKHTVTYELNGGKFSENADVSHTSYYNYYTKVCAPVKSGYQFTGWSLGENDHIDRTNAVDWNGETLVAHWSAEAPIDINSCEFEMDGYSYIDGKEEYSVTIYDSDEENGSYLLEGLDFLLTFKNNTKPAAATDENPPTVTITGIGKYTGTITKTFDITKCEVRLPYLNDKWGRAVELNIKAGEPLSSIDLSQVRVYSKRTRYIGEVKGTFSWKDGSYVPDKEAGDFTYGYEDKNIELIFTPENGEWFDTTTFSNNVILCVKAETMENCSVTFKEGKDTYLWTGEEIKPEVIVKDGNTVLEEGEDYSLSYAGYINAVGSKEDDYAPTITICGLNKYYGTKKVKYLIKKSAIIESLPIASTITVGQKLSLSTLSGGKVVDGEGNKVSGSFQWKDGDIVPGISDSKQTKYEVVFIPDSEEYPEITCKITLEVTEAPAATITTKLPVVGTVLKDKSKKAWYVVTKVKKSKVEVQYKKPVKNAKSVTVPKTVKLSDGTNAKVTSVGKKAFKGCKKLKKITIGTEVVSIGANAFTNCKNLRTIVIKSKKLKTLSKSAWKGISSKTTIKVPKSKYKTYKKLFQKKGLKKSVKIVKF